MFNRGHDAHTQQYQDARYRLRKGMAKVALREKLGIRRAVDSRGQPMRAQEMAERHSLTTLERWARGWSGDRMKPTKVWCQVCKRAGRDPFQEPGHECVPEETPSAAVCGV